jgi:uncharacterized protein (DUF1810 family)
MTLFALAVPGEPVFQMALEKYFDGEREGRTVELLGMRKSADGAD